MLTRSKTCCLFIINITFVWDYKWEQKLITAAKQMLCFAHQPVWLDLLVGEREEKNEEVKERDGTRAGGHELSIQTWQLLYVWNALALIAVPLGERREALYRWRERDREREVMGEGSIFQAIYCNHHSLINQTFHHKSSMCVCVPAVVYTTERKPSALSFFSMHALYSYSPLSISMDENLWLFVSFHACLISYTPFSFSHLILNPSGWRRNCN